MFAFGIKAVRVTALTLAFLGTTGVHETAFAGCSDFTKRMREIRNIDQTSDTLVLAHRGVWGNQNLYPDLPENSLGAVDNAMTSCVDGIELDR